MIPNRVMEVDDYLAMARRRLRMILFLGLVALAVGSLISLRASPKYTSTATIMVDKPEVIPSGIVKPLAPTYLQINFREIGERRERILALEQQVLSRSHLQEVVDHLGLAKNGKSPDAVIDEIQANFSITEADLTASIGSPTPSTSSSGSNASQAPAVPYSYTTPGYSIGFTAGNPHDAQRICAELTSDLLTEDIETREQRSADTTEFLSRQVAEARIDLDEQDQKLALFKGQHLGQLPGDMEENLRVLSGLNSQLEASTQALNRAQQDKTYADSILAQQLDAWKSSQSSLTSDSIERQLAALQTQLVGLQTRYTDNHPEVVKMKRDIAGLEAKKKNLANSPDQKAVTDQMVVRAEPPQILQLRAQVNQSEGIIDRATQEQRRLQQMIAAYQSRLTLSPQVEEEYNRLTRDSQTAHQVYEGLLGSKSEAEIHADMQRHQEGERLRLLHPASLPGPPSLLERWKYAGTGLGGGLILGICIALWLEFRDKALRNEADVLAGVELPMLASIPSVDAVTINGHLRYSGEQENGRILTNRL
jgi:uncharacterized protein involved in exopolysaccharide biosynthesis